jgi:hypothetical protein
MLYVVLPSVGISKVHDFQLTERFVCRGLNFTIIRHSNEDKGLAKELTDSHFDFCQPDNRTKCTTMALKLTVSIN